MKQTLSTLAAILALASPAQAQDTCRNTLAKQQSTLSAIEKELLQYGARIETAKHTFLYLAFDDGKQMYEIGASYDTSTCKMEDVFIHRSIKANADSGNKEWIPMSTVRKKDPRGNELISSYALLLADIIEALPEDKTKYNTASVPLPFVLAANGTKTQTKEGSQYDWFDTDSEISVQGIDKDDNGILDSLFVKKGAFTYEDKTADGISAGDMQYVGTRYRFDSLRPQEIIGSALHQNFYVGAEHVRRITRVAEKRMRK